MGKLLLSQGQVSILFSAVIVFLFTLALFLSGYVLQQRYVHSLQLAIKPRLPKPLPAQAPLQPPTLDVKWARGMGERLEVDESVQQAMDAPSIDWSGLGYVQVVKDHSELCSAIMLLADLQEKRSPAKRILMFPKAWLKETSEDDWDPQMTTTKRLLRTAARRHGARLVPIEPAEAGADEALASSYSIAAMYSLTTYERLIYLHAPGVVLDASALDSLLAFSKSKPMSAFPATPERKELSTSLLLISPSHETYQQLRERLVSQPSTDLELLRHAFDTPESLIAESTLAMGNVVYESQSLRDASDDFNATSFNEMTTFVRLREPDMPGPEYDVPYAERARLRPQNAQAREAWEKVYEMFRQRRMEVCGLDLEYWMPPAAEQPRAAAPVEL
ncbi:uncharacterized protein CC84DRAFT_1104110 [Paraphaeosphaeria sporulosa]|uniref:Glycosyltransferase family 8 protein n=1 Tax=Paraphaeosphaeria sporulosa TaxID=1460663 RepID=A0A177BXG3_9PLEO|nr:uncharacterized protein CC84DRAFT_1104110 [Paraphaeosphaeria sporulosa]OAF99207.1 hypothetical protein CC84DRAFT_1104110 [Paraphaeosphaeria sporulosa]